LCNASGEFLDGIEGKSVKNPLTWNSRDFMTGKPGYGTYIYFGELGRLEEQRGRRYDLSVTVTKALFISLMLPSPIFIERTSYAGSLNAIYCIPIQLFSFINYTSAAFRTNAAQPFI